VHGDPKCVASVSEPLRVPVCDWGRFPFGIGKRRLTMQCNPHPQMPLFRPMGSGWLTNPVRRLGLTYLSSRFRSLAPNTRFLEIRANAIPYGLLMEKNSSSMLSSQEN